MREKLEYYALVFFIKFTKILPISYTYKICEKFAILIFYLSSRRRKLAIENLSLAYPNLKEDEVIELVKKNYISISKTVAESLMLYTGKIALEELIINKKEMISTIKKLTNEASNGVIFMGSHFGNWEIMPQFSAKNGFPVLVIGREGNNTLIEKNITTKFRTKFGNSLAYKHEAMSKMLKHLKQNGIVGIMIDQKADVVNSVESEFFQRKCKSTKSVASLALKYNPKIAFMIPLRKYEKYEIIIKEVKMPNLTDNKEENTKILTRLYDSELENLVRLAPEQWFWMHNRWKID